MLNCLAGDTDVLATAQLMSHGPSCLLTMLMTLEAKGAGGIISAAEASTVGKQPLPGAADTATSRLAMVLTGDSVEEGQGGLPICAVDTASP